MPEAAVLATRRARLEKGAITVSTAHGHRMGPWVDTPPGESFWPCERTATCASCGHQASVHTNEHTGGFAVRALTSACRGETDEVIREREHRARYDWATLHRGEALPDGHVLGVDLEVRIDWTTGLDWTTKLRRSTAHAHVEIPDVHYRSRPADGATPSGSPGGVRGRGPTREAALDDLRAQLVRYLRDQAYKVERERGLLAHLATFVVPPAGEDDEPTPRPEPTLADVHERTRRELRVTLARYHARLAHPAKAEPLILLRRRVTALEHVLRFLGDLMTIESDLQHAAAPPSPEERGTP